MSAARVMNAALRASAPDDKDAAQCAQSRRPLWVKGSCGRQADGTAGLPPSPEMPVRSDTYASCHRPTCALYAMRVSKKKSASRLTIEFIATCSECTRWPRCLTYSYAACSRSKSG